MKSQNIIRPIICIIILATISGCYSNYAKTHEKTGTESFEKGNYIGAEESLKESVKHLDRTGVESYLTYSKLAVTLRQQGKFDESEIYARKALVITEGEYGKDSEENLIPLVTLGTALRGQKKYDESEAVLIRCVKLAKEKNIKDYMAAAIIGVGLTYTEQGRFDEAEYAYGQGLQLTSNISGTRSQEYAAILNNIGSLYIAKKDYKQAVDYIEKALGIYDETVGRAHPSTQKVLFNLRTAKFFVKQNR